MKDTFFEKMFSVRTAVTFFLLAFMFLTCILRLTVLSVSSSGKTQNGICLTACPLRGIIYDSNMTALNSGNTKIFAAVLPTPAAKAAIEADLPEEKASEVLKILAQNKPAVCEVESQIDCEGITCITVNESINSAYAHHLLGYTDLSGNGVSGIEAAYNEILGEGNGLTAQFATNGKGGLLLGVPPTFSGESIKENGVVLTIDLSVQNTVENISRDIESGAVVVADIKSGKIRAMVSRPDYNPDNLSEFLNLENSPLVNKAIKSYSVGSVFKPCIAAAVIENGFGEMTISCEGKTVIEGRAFNCHKHDGHGTVNLSGALKDSCNCFFYNAAISLGKDTVYKYAKKFDFGNKICFADNMFTDKGIISNDLSSPSKLANFAIGQGETLISPVGMLTLYCAIANGGKYRLPSVVEETIVNGKTEKFKTSALTAPIKPETANKIKNDLSEVILSGTGNAAKSEKVTAAGKTATAQTGRKDKDGKEINNNWFCGFFPLDAPKYAVIIMSEKQGNKTPSQIFKEISEELS